MKRIANLYFHLPIFLQNLIINISAIKIKRYRYKQYEFYSKRLSDFSKLNNKQLVNFLTNATHSSFWESRFCDFKIDITKNKNISHEISKLPILTKQEVLNHTFEISPKVKKLKTKKIKTSGTTGSGLVFPQTQDMENAQWAVWWRYRNWHGIELDTWMAWFGGRAIANIKQSKPPYWRTNYPMKQVMFSAHHLNNNTVASYFNKIKERKLTWIHGYPSQIAQLAHLIRQNNLGKLPELKIITLGAENFLETQKAIIKEVFDVPAVQHYGLAEGVANISQHKDGTLKPDQDFCYTEFIPVNDYDPTICKIIGTNYYNLAFPLIRYDTGDIAKVKWFEDGTVEVISIDGRNEDYITLPNGVKLGRLDHIFKDFLEVKEAQIYQADKNHIILRVVKGDNYTNKTEQRLQIEASKYLGENIHTSIEYLKKVPRTKSGKLKFVISNIS